MKKTPLILSIIAVVVALAALAMEFIGCDGKNKPADISGQGTSAVAGDVVYLQIDSLVLNYDMYNDLMSAFQTKAVGVQDDLQKKGRKLESDMKAFESQIQKGLLTRSAAETQQNSLLQRQQKLQEEAAQKQQELSEEEFVLNNQVMDAIKTFLTEYNEEHQFALILTTSAASNSVIEGSTSLDITADVLAGLNDAYIKVRNK